jgi:hypothetical protein
MADKERLRRQNARLKAEIEAMKPVVTAAVNLVRSGYDGPFMGDEVQPLFSAVAAYEKTVGIKPPTPSTPPKPICRAPQGACINHLVCNIGKRCIWRPDESGPITND